MEGAYAFSLYFWRRVNMLPFNVALTSLIIFRMFHGMYPCQQRHIVHYQWDCEESNQVWYESDVFRA
jgi:hypothetical protein